MRLQNNQGDLCHKIRLDVNVLFFSITKAGSPITCYAKKNLIAFLLQVQLQFAVKISIVTIIRINLILDYIVILTYFIRYLIVTMKTPNHLC